MSKWISAKEKLPNPQKDGAKVLLWREMNISQKAQEISIHESSMVKHCNLDETWWMPLPSPPIFY